MHPEKRRGRPKSTEPVTLLARVDKQFAEEVRAYADKHHVSVSGLVRDGLHWRISGQPAIAPPSDTPTPTAHPEAQTIAAQLRQLAARLEQREQASTQTSIDVIHVIQELQESPFVSDTNIAPPTPARPRYRQGRAPGPLRRRILALLAEHPEGLKAAEMRAFLKPKQGESLGDTLQGMVRMGKLTTHEKGQGKRYQLPV